MGLKARGQLTGRNVQVLSVPSPSSSSYFKCLHNERSLLVIAMRLQGGV